MSPWLSWRRRPLRRVAFYPTCLVALLLGCESTQSPSTVAAPRGQFRAQGVQIRELRDGKVLWTGTLKTAEGTVKRIAGQGIELTRHPQVEGETPFTVHAEKGNLRLDKGHATFPTVRLETEDGTVIEAEHTIYNEKYQSLTATGPLRLTSKQIEVDATKAVVFLAQGSIRLTGPINGTLSAASAP